MLLDPEKIPLSPREEPPSRAPAVTVLGGNYYVVWRGPYTVGEWYTEAIFGARVTAAGVILDTNGSPLLGSDMPLSGPAIHSHGSECLVAATAGGALQWVRVSSAGLTVATNTLAASASTNRPALAFNGTNYLVVWAELRNDDSDLYGARLSIQGDIIDTNPIAVYQGTGWQLAPTAASDGRDFLVAWEHWSSLEASDASLFGTRLSGAGQLIGINEIPIGALPNTQTEAAVAANGSNYLVVWCDDRVLAKYSIYGIRLSPEGTLLDPNGLLFARDWGHAWNPSVAANGDQYLVVWRAGYYNNLCQIWGKRVSGSGALLDPSPIDLVSGRVGSLAVAACGSTYLATWEQDSDIVGAVVGREGTVVAPNIAINAAPAYQGVPHVAGNGTNYLVVWSDGRNLTNYDIYGARVSQAGVVLPPNEFPIASGTNSQRTPDVTASANGFFVAWMELDPSGAASIRGARVSPSGTVLDPDGILVSTNAMSVAPSLANDGLNVLVLWVTDGSRQCAGLRLDSRGQVLPYSQFVFDSHDYTSGTHRAAYGGNRTYLVVHQAWRDNTQRIMGNWVNCNELMLEPLRIENGQAILRWSAPYPYGYCVAYKTNLNDPEWTVLFDASRPGPPTDTVVDSTIGNAPQRFYQIMAWPPP